MPRAAFTQAAITRAVRAAEAMGWAVAGFEVTKDGVIRVLKQVDKPKEDTQPAEPKRWGE